MQRTLQLNLNSYAERRSSWLIKVFQSKAREFLTRASGSFAPHPLRDVLTKRRWWEKAHPTHGPRQGVPRQRLVGGQVLGRPVAERPALSPRPKPRPVLISYAPTHRVDRGRRDRPRSRVRGTYSRWWARHACGSTGVVRNFDPSA